MKNKSVRTVIHKCLRTFLDSTGRTGDKFDESTNLIQGLGLSSDEGVDFVLDLCETLNINLPGDFNPFIHESGRRGLQVSEMTTRVENLVSQSGAAA